MHHNDLREGDPRHDNTDLFVFTSPEDPHRTVLILDVHPELSPGAEPVDARVSYEIKVDQDGDLEPDLAFHPLFDRHVDGSWTTSLLLATDAAAAGTARVGEEVLSGIPVSFGPTARAERRGRGGGDFRFFASPRSDPFFANRDGFANGVQWTGRDCFADNDIFCIALEVPDSALNGAQSIAVWTRTVGIASQHVLNQAGRLGNNVFRPEPEVFQTVAPVQQRERYLPHYVEGFRAMGYPEPDAARLAEEWVPDVLIFDPAQPSGFPNGRLLTDDVVANAVKILTRAPCPPRPTRTSCRSSRSSGRPTAPEPGAHLAPAA
ncbi:DUF4331 family protein [Sinomonas flava]|uniref:DUF4331 family protein n=1 Tax=Sinomonas flava TaxID=496857 RepID=UPI0039A676CA